MDFRTLQYFVTVAAELNITRAASVLQMSQPPLSHQMKLLEQELGTALFVRNKQGLTLTPTGSILLKRAKQILELAQNTRDEISGYENELSGNLVLGTVEGRAPFLLARWIAGFRDEFPLVTFTVRHGGTDDILEQLQHHLMDLAIIAAPYNEEILDGFYVDRQPWVAIIPAGHPLAGSDGKNIRLRDLKDVPLIIPERSYRGAAIERWFEEQDIVPSFVCRVSSYTDAVALVEQEIGICIFPQTTYSPNPHIVTKLIIDPPKAAQYVLVWLKDQPLPEMAASFREYIQDFLEEDRMHSERFQTKEEEFVLPPEAQLL